jgi:hypothetical protein
MISSSALLVGGGRLGFGDVLSCCVPASNSESLFNRGAIVCVLDSTSFWFVYPSPNKRETSLKVVGSTCFRNNAGSRRYPSREAFSFHFDGNFARAGSNFSGQKLVPHADKLVAFPIAWLLGVLAQKTIGALLWI